MKSHFTHVRDKKIRIGYITLELETGYFVIKSYLTFSSEETKNLELEKKKKKKSLLYAHCRVSFNAIN